MIDIRIEQLYYLVEVAQSRSISLAAERLHISQPSVSQAIHNLEMELGVKLFDRTRLGLHLTDAGESILKQAKEILQMIEELKLGANRQLLPLTGNLSLATVPSMCQTLLPKTLVDFKYRYTSVNITLKENPSSRVIEEVKSGKADIGFVAMPTADSEIEKILETLEKGDVLYESLLSAEMMACVGKSSPLSTNNPISLKDIARHPIILLSPDHSMHYFITKMLKRYGNPSIFFSSDSSSGSIKRIVSEGLATAFYSTLALEDDPYVMSGRIIPLRIINETVGMSYGWIRTNHHHFSVAAEEFVRMLKARCYIHITSETSRPIRSPFP